LISDNFHAASMLDWQPGWVMRDPEFGRPTIFQFWFDNFGVFIPLALCLLAVCSWRLWKSEINWNEKLPEDIAFLLPAAAMFVSGLLFKFAPWEWDNLKLMIWAYFLILPFLWSDLIARWSTPVRVGACIALFGSGFVSLFGGLAAGRSGFEFSDRGDLDAVGMAVRSLPAEARFAAYPTYNHPLLLQGRKVVLGYPGHLWTQGFKNYENVEQKLRELMEGAQNWREIALALRVRYIFWGGKRCTIIPRANDHGRQRHRSLLLAIGARFMIWKADEALKHFNALTRQRIPRSGVFGSLRCALRQRDAFVVVEMGARERQNRLRSRDRQSCKGDSLGEFARSARR